MASNGACSKQEVRRVRISPAHLSHDWPLYHPLFLFDDGFGEIDLTPLCVPLTNTLRG